MVTAVDTLFLVPSRISKVPNNGGMDNRGSTVLYQHCCSNDCVKTGYDEGTAQEYKSILSFKLYSASNCIPINTIMHAL